MVDREPGRPWWDRLRDRGPSPHLGLFGRSRTNPPQKKFPWGKYGLHRALGGAGSGGRWRGAGSGGRGLWGAHSNALARSRHWRALARSRHRRALSRSRHWSPYHPLINNQYPQRQVYLCLWRAWGSRGRRNHLRRGWRPNLRRERRHNHRRGWRNKFSSGRQQADDPRAIPAGN